MSNNPVIEMMLKTAVFDLLTLKILNFRLDTIEDLE
ncbi:hypothetical protein Pan54_19180 [Rubinisphaera italica]|uniref:Uncharacterized protein n=1 Tax=Rubinisphaera italica TaxID=2527969 RepID=A0A5C5XFQ3_9PLAN|nr:hypothetical protein Pan54_19180 [Rubinisphaera italica]